MHDLSPSVTWTELNIQNILPASEKRKGGGFVIPYEVKRGYCPSGIEKFDLHTEKKTLHICSSTQAGKGSSVMTP